MSRVKEKTLLQNTFRTSWSALSVQYGPQDRVPTSASGYVCFDVVSGEDAVREICSVSRTRAAGFVQIDLYLPKGAGDYTARTHTDTIAGILANKSLTDGTMHIVTRGVDGPRYSR